MSRTAFLSDPHFFHEKLAKLRGFASAADMAEVIVHRVNSKLDKHDTLWWLGDISMGSAEQTIKLFRRMKGNHKLVMGNHDKHMKPEVKAIFGEVQTLKFLKVGIPEGGETKAYGFALCHFPMLVWEKSHYQAIHLHGHSHGHLLYPACLQNSRIMDVGCEPMAYTPIFAEEVVERMRHKCHVAIDLHREKPEPDLKFVNGSSITFQ